jgi:CelD/BcsL family acetyltransferase involved in cellulose biosynthesis
MYSVELINEPAEFLALEPAWNNAVDRARVPYPFLRHEWLRAWWECFGQGQELHILTVKSQNRICAIEPLMLERTQMYGLPVRRLRLMHNDHTPRADFILADRHDGACQAIWDALFQAKSGWDVLQLGQLPEESATRDRFRDMAVERGHATGIWQSSASPYVTLAASWDAYAATLSAKFRQNLRNRLARLARLGDPALEVLSDPAEIRESRADAVRLESSGWKDGEGTAIQSDQAVDRFYTLLTQRAADCRWMRVLFLSVGGKRIAASLAAVYENRLFLLKTGYDPEYAKCSPFKLLTYFAIHHAIDSRLDEVDFLGDAEAWKLEWTPKTRAHDWLFVYSGTPRARLLHPIKFQFLPALKRLQSCTSPHSRV